MMGLWITKNSVKVFENPWIVLHDEQVINPRGGESEYGRIHFKHAAMGIIPLDNDLNTYLVGQWRYPLNAYSWEIPMGGGHLDEDALGSAKRELLEPSHKGVPKAQVELQEIAASVLRILTEEVVAPVESVGPAEGVVSLKNTISNLETVQ